MSYKDIQVITQLVSGGLFLMVLLGVAVYVALPSNAARFEKQSRLPLENEDLDTDTNKNG